MVDEKYVGYRVITSTYAYFPTKEGAIDFANFGRNKGIRTEVITEEEYQKNHYPPQMQDLTKI